MAAVARQSHKRALPGALIQQRPKRSPAAPTPEDRVGAIGLLTVMPNNPVTGTQHYSTTAAGTQPPGSRRRGEEQHGRCHDDAPQ
jgi:hypothetical protein